MTPQNPAQAVSDQSLGAASANRINFLIDAIENELLQWAVYGGHVEVNVMFFTKQLRAVINGGPK